MTIVLADDITGAAEIAGISLRYGLKTLLITNITSSVHYDADTVVIATNIRSMTKEAAKELTMKLCNDICNYIHNEQIPCWLFKKTDSVLRGHINDELSIMMKAMNYKYAMLIAQNPSKGRIIKNGTYYINNILLSETLFSKDPEFPAYTSDPTALVGGKCEIMPVEKNITCADGTVFIGESTTKNEIVRQLAKTDKSCLLAGGADFFETFILDKHPATTLQPVKRGSIADGISSNKSLIISGSTQGKSIAHTKLMDSVKAKEFSIPDDVFEGGDPTAWTESVCNMYKTLQATIIRIGEHTFKGAEYAIRLRKTMAETAKKLIDTQNPAYLIIEGGATAFAILEATSWNTFSITQELAPGVVAMKHGQTTIIMKPGSYDWGGLFSQP